MHTGKNQITALGFSLLIALPIFLSVGIVVKQKIVQLQRTERFDTEFLQTISIESKKIYWVKPGKEILIDGKLFDVKSCKPSGDMMLLTGFFDHKEDKLVKHIRDLIHKKTDSKSPANHLAVKFLFYPKYKETNTFFIQNNWQNIARQFRVYTDVIFKITYPSPTPPPKVC